MNYRPAAYPMAKTPALLEDLDEIINVYLLSLYRYDKRKHKIFEQRSIVISYHNHERLFVDLELIVNALNEADGVSRQQFFFDLEDLSETTQIKTLQFDSIVKHLGKPLVIAKRSPRTGQVYADVDMQFCPHTCTPLRFMITTVK